MNPLKNLLLLSVLLLCGKLQAQTPTVFITLTVDTTLLGNDRNAPGGCTFSVEPADKLVFNDPNNPKLFTIQVDSSDVIEWQGKTTGDVEVKIRRISFIRGTNIFDSEIVKGTMINGKEKVKANPKRNTLEDKDYEYSIRFKMKGDFFKFYEIDPKIKVGNT
ncbi:hypothetical protein [Portibacter marinus]|uniref:hypothetical protein n=1 Tax=Portibacter marinus TaxID=2898660 RepID=UPI001F24E3FF|nr:hypothetical protein [Portibacter marinus]